MSDAEVPEADALEQSTTVESDVGADAGPQLDQEASEADALEQSAPVRPSARAGEPSIGIEVSEADALDQAAEVGHPDDERSP